MLRPDYTQAFARDVKRLTHKHADVEPLKQVIRLILEDTADSRDDLRRHHRMHDLRGRWVGSHECHIANAGDWLLIWSTGNGMAVFQRTGSHDELFG